MNNKRREDKVWEGGMYGVIEKQETNRGGVKRCTENTHQKQQQQNNTLFLLLPWNMANTAIDRSSFYFYFTPTQYNYNKSNAHLDQIHHQNNHDNEYERGSLL